MAEERVQRLLDGLTTSGKTSRFPFFVNPISLDFYLENEISHRQTATIYNPYDFPMLYHVHVEPEYKDLYHIPSEESVIGPHSSANVVFTHLKPVQSYLLVSTLFLITMKDVHTKKELGKKCIVGILRSLYGASPKVQEKSATESDDEDEEEKKSTSSRCKEKKEPAKSAKRFTTSQVRSLFILAVILFSGVMMSSEDKRNRIAVFPKCLYLTLFIFSLALW